MAGVVKLGSSGAPVAGFAAGLDCRFAVKIAGFSDRTLAAMFSLTAGDGTGNRSHLAKLAPAGEFMRLLFPYPAFAGGTVIFDDDIVEFVILPDQSLIVSVVRGREKILIWGDLPRLRRMARLHPAGQADFAFRVPELGSQRDRNPSRGCGSSRKYSSVTARSHLPA